MQRTLWIIVLFLCLIVGSFVWFVATWDREREQPVSRWGSDIAVIALMLGSADHSP